MSSFENCTHVTPECPVRFTLYRHYPNLPANAFLTALFATLLVFQLAFGIWKRTWSYMIWVSIGMFGELLGYIGRLIMHANPYSQTGLEIEIIALVLAPSFLAAGIYLTLKHTINHVGPEYSRIEPAWYPWIFVGCDLFSIFVQAIGGGVAAGAGSSGSESLANTGDDLIIAGIAIQILSMAIFGWFAIDYYQRLKRAKTNDSGSWRGRSKTEKSTRGNSLDANFEKGRAKESRRIIVFYYAMSFAYITILTRCIYRIHEMAGGWDNSRMRNELLFLLLDGMMVALASIAMTVAHPGILFTPWRTTKRSGMTESAGETGLVAESD